MKNNLPVKLSDLYKQYAAGKLEKHQYIDMMHERHQQLFDYFDYLKKTEVESIVINNQIIYITTKGSQIKLLLDRFDRRFLPTEMLNFHAIDAQERGLVFWLATKCPTIFDVGANLGWYSLNFDRLPGVKKIYAFEPVPYTYDFFKKHLKMNQAKRVIALNFGFSDTNEEKFFYWSKNETGSSSMANIQNRRSADKVKCKVTTMDKFMKNRRHGLDFIKCDVEGAELFVFKGAVKTLARFKPIIFTEMLRKWSNKFGYHPDDIINLLAGLGYDCFGYVHNRIKKISSVSPELETTNFFFFHRVKHKKIIRKIIK